MSKRYSVDPGPLGDDAKLFLSWITDIDFIDHDFSNPDAWMCCTIRDGDTPVTVIVFEFKSPHDAHATVAVTDPRGLSRQLLTALFRGVFSKAARITLLVTPDNKPVHEQVWRMGFKMEGYLRRGYDGKQDAMVYGMLPEDCLYLCGQPFRYRVVQATHDLAQRMQ